MRQTLWRPSAPSQRHPQSTDRLSRGSTGKHYVQRVFSRSKVIGSNWKQPTWFPHSASFGARANCPEIPLTENAPSVPAKDGTLALDLDAYAVRLLRFE